MITAASRSRMTRVAFIRPPGSDRLRLPALDGPRYRVERRQLGLERVQEAEEVLTPDETLGARGDEAEHRGLNRPVGLNAGLEMDVAAPPGTEVDAHDRRHAGERLRHARQDLHRHLRRVRLHPGMLAE